MTVEVPHEHVTCPRCGGEGSVSRVHGPSMRRLREAAGLTQRELANRLQPRISSVYLSDMELGRRPMSEEVARQITLVCQKPGPDPGPVKKL